MNLQEMPKDHFSVILVRDRLKSSFGLVHSESDCESESTQEKEESLMNFSVLSRTEI